MADATPDSPTASGYQRADLTRAQLDARPGRVVLDFGVNGCGYCRAAAPAVHAGLAGRPEVDHLRIEDGPGRRLGRSFGVRLWPTLIFLRDGVERARLVRPASAEEVTEALAALDTAP